MIGFDAWGDNHRQDISGSCTYTHGAPDAGVIHHYRVDGSVIEAKQGCLC